MQAGDPEPQPALAEGDSLAYLILTRREGEGPVRFELGATGRGPAYQDLADRLCKQIRAWDGDREARPTIKLYPAGTPDSKIGNGYIIDKPGCRVAISY